ncbi:hypothetical protein ACN4GS_09930 [Burkholderia pseudomallei]|uniref:hypothetical protein n=2 Tax=Burkholderiaceae TaxID=119060 RepID=UPI003AF9AD0A
MNIEKRLKRAYEVRKCRFRRLRERIAATNTTELPDETVIEILNARSGPWSKPMTVEELFASLGTE